jgi:hypothetical protein
MQIPTENGFDLDKRCLISISALKMNLAIELFIPSDI